MKKVMIASTARTPVGGFQSNFKDIPEQNLGAYAMITAIKNAGIDATSIDEIIVGTAKQTSTPSNCARHTMLVAKLPIEIPAYTVHRQSASSIQAIMSGFSKIKNNDANVILAGGTESMSLIPLEIHNARYKFDENTRIIFNPILEQVTSAQPKNKYSEVTIDKISKNLASFYNISEQEISDYTESSCNKAKKFSTEDFIIPIDVKQRKNTLTFDSDEIYSTHNNIAQPADCAAMCVLLSEEKAKELNVEVLGEIVSFGISAGDPTSKGILGIEAIVSALDRADVNIEDVDIIEINELSATQILATCAELRKMGLSVSDIEKKVNPNGGCLATGNPWGAAGAMLLNKLMSELKQYNKDIGLIVTPAEGGQAMAMLVRRN